MVGAGVSVNLDKGDNMSITKAKLIQVVSQQANQLNAQANEIKEMKANYEARIAQLEAAMAKQK